MCAEVAWQSEQDQNLLGEEWKEELIITSERSKRAESTYISVPPISPIYSVCDWLLKRTRTSMGYQRNTFAAVIGKVLEGGSDEKRGPKKLGKGERDG